MVIFFRTKIRTEAAKPVDSTVYEYAASMVYLCSQEAPVEVDWKSLAEYILLRQEIPACGRSLGTRLPAASIRGVRTTQKRHPPSIRRSSHANRTNAIRLKVSRLEFILYVSHAYACMMHPV